MLGKAFGIKSHFVDADHIGDLQEGINHFLAVISHFELIDIRYQMMYVKGEMLYHTAMIIYREDKPNANS